MKLLCGGKQFRSYLHYTPLDCDEHACHLGFRRQSGNLTLTSSFPVTAPSETSRRILD
jgi:hypothetical protein